MKVLLVEFFNGDTTEAEAFQTKESLIEWYDEHINEDEDYEEVIAKFKENLTIEEHGFNIGHHGFTIYYNYEVM